MKNVIFLLLIFDRPRERTYLVNPNNLVTGTTTSRMNEFEEIRRVNTFNKKQLQA